MLNPTSVWLRGEAIRRQGFLLTAGKTAAAAQPVCRLHRALSPAGAPTSHRPRDQRPAAGGNDGLFPLGPDPMTAALELRPRSEPGSSAAAPGFAAATARTSAKPSGPLLAAGAQLPALRSPLNPPAASSSSSSSSRRVSIPRRPPLFCPFARVSLRFLFPVAPSPACPRSPAPSRHPTPLPSSPGSFPAPRRRPQPPAPARPALHPV